MAPAPRITSYMEYKIYHHCDARLSGVFHIRTWRLQLSKDCSKTRQCTHIWPDISCGIFYLVSHEPSI